MAALFTAAKISVLLALHKIIDLFINCIHQTSLPRRDSSRNSPRSMWVEGTRDEALRTSAQEACIRQVHCIQDESLVVSLACIIYWNGFIFLIWWPIASPLTSEVPPSSPKIGSKSEVFLNVTAKDANGEVGFSTAHQMLSVQEPAGPASSFLQLAVKRSGTANRVVVHWNITSNSNTFFPNDTGPQRGKIVFEEGTT